MNLPGSVHPVQPGTPCEDCDQSATVLLQGETDSMGAEYHPLCDNCYSKYRNAPPTTGFCSHCHKDRELKPWRDFEEGSNGPVYYICDECRERCREYDRQQWAQMEPTFEEALDLFPEDETGDICCCGTSDCPEYDNHMEAYNNIHGVNNEDDHR